MTNSVCRGRRSPRPSASRSRPRSTATSGPRAVDRSASPTQHGARLSPRSAAPACASPRPLSSTWSDIDLAHCKIRVKDAKTDAGVRDVDVRLRLADELRAYLATRAWDAANCARSPSRHAQATAATRTTSATESSPPHCGGRTSSAVEEVFRLIDQCARHAAHLAADVHQHHAQRGRRGALRPGPGRPQGSTLTLRIYALVLKRRSPPPRRRRLQ